MNITQKLLVITTLLATPNVALASNLSSDCVLDSNDPYDMGYVMDIGENKGECMSTHARPAIQTEESLARPIWKDSLQVANVSHMNEFYTAEIPMHGIEEVIFQVENFEAPVPAAHTQVRLKYYDHSPVVLKKQSGDSPEEVVVYDLVLSIEATGERGYSYDIFKGLGENLKTVYRIKTLDSFVERVIVGKGSEVKQWKMNLSKNEKRKFLVNYIYHSSKKGFSDTYNTLKLNCTTELLRLVDRSTKNNVRKSLGKFFTLDLYPAIIKPALISRGLVNGNGSSDLEDLADDPSIAHLL